MVEFALEDAESGIGDAAAGAQGHQLLALGVKQRSSKAPEGLDRRFVGGLRSRLRDNTQPVLRSPAAVTVQQRRQREALTHERDDHHGVGA